MFGSLSTSILLQTIFVIVQNWKSNWREFGEELAFALVGFIAPKYAYKVAKGIDREKGALLDPLMAMVSCKCIELFSEGLPSGG